MQKTQQIMIDFDRIDFSCLEFGEKAFAEEGLLEPITNAPAFTTADYKGVPVDTASAKNQEPLRDVQEYGVKSIPYYLTQARENPLYGENITGAPEINYVRSGVGKLLAEANNILARTGLELAVVDAHRSPETQNALFAFFCARGRKQGLRETEAVNFALRYCSSAENFSADNPATWTIHSTGAAVDIYLCDKKSAKIVDCGETRFDNPEPITHTDYYEKLSSRRLLAAKEEGYKNARRVLYNVMTGLGFTNYGYECFHFGTDDPYAACVHGGMAAYGYIPAP